MIKLHWLLLLILFSINVQAENITSWTLTRATLSGAINGNCLRYKLPRKFCIWVSPFGGRKLTPVLDHYLPDLVVVVYRNNDENPWTEAKILLDKMSATAQETVFPHVGSGNHSFLDAHEQSVIFKEADVIGNPGLTVMPHYFKLVLLPSTAKPLFPYFQSMIDSFLWRGFMPQALPEEAAAVALGEFHHVGRGLTDWGGVYPHEGTVMSQDDARASMVIAQRAADLLTNTMPYLHVHQTLSLTCGQHCQSSAIKENSDETLFQLVYPEQSDCAVLGSDQSYNEKMLNEKGAYVWIVWRHYHGCADGDGLYIGETP
jgi:integrating conjugative element protein (TIGR03756 family)